MFRNIFLLILLGSLVGCAPIKTQTTVFHTPNYTPKGTLIVMASDPKLNNSLEFANYKAKFERKLSEHGYSIVNDTEKAKYAALVAYGISGGRTAIISDPIYNDLGQKIGSETSSKTRYTRTISLEIVRVESLQEGRIPEKIYESKTRSVGSCGVMNRIFDLMLNSMFKNFPGDNGSTKTSYDTANIGC